MLDKALRGSRAYWGWLSLLGIVFLAGCIAYIRQLSYGLGMTGMGRDVSWGLYIANFTFIVGVAASAVAVVIPYYLHDHKEFGTIVIFGEFLAVCAVIMAMLFVFVDLGQPGRVFNLMLYASPNSVLFWDIVVLTVYLLLNIVIAWITLDARRKEQAPPSWVGKLILLSIPWAISIHTVTAFIYSGLAARPFWLTALMAPRFLASAFASGPALVIVMCLVMKRVAKFDPGKEAVHRISEIVTYALSVSLFFWIVELFTTYYSGVPEPIRNFQYLLFGLNSKTGLVPWTWTSLALTVLAIVLLVRRKTRENPGTLAIACIAGFIAVWIDKGLGLIVPGLVPSPTGQLIEYLPTLNEGMITIGIWALGFLILTILYKIAIAILQEGHQ